MHITFTYVFFKVLNRYGAIPLFLALAIVTLLAVLCILKTPKLPHLTTALAGGVLLFSIAGAIAAAPAAVRSGIRLIQFFQAVFSMPPLSGPFVVGDAKIALAPIPQADPAPGKPILVHLYYPIEPDSERSTADQSQSACLQLDGIVHLPETHQLYRLVLLAPGLYGTPSSIALMARNLASHGYIVAGIDDPARDAPTSGASVSDDEIRLRPFDFSSAEALEATRRRSDVRVEQVASRALATLDRLEECIENNARLQGQIEFKKVGFVGFSFGGAAAAESSFMDSRIAAVVNLDGSLFGHGAKAPVNVPLLWMHSDFSRQELFNPNSPLRYQYMLDQNDLQIVAAQAKRPDSYLFVISGSEHGSFEDPPSPGPKDLIKWLILDPYRAHAIIDAYLIGFLDAYLKGDKRGLLGANDPRYPEIRILTAD